jgi:hypothetical protein
VDTVFDPCSPLTIMPGSDTQAHEIQGIEDAILAWDRVLPTRIDIGDPVDDSPVISIYFDPGDTFYRALYLDKRGEILVSRDRLSADDLGLAIAHELGHAFGLLHVSKDERPSVMNVGNLEFLPSAEDSHLVSDLWAACADD